MPDNAVAADLYRRTSTGRDMNALIVVIVAPADDSFCYRLQQLG
jgi:hypothetical protein